jgi:proteasome lid subunit RPN8/RPN11
MNENDGNEREYATGNDATMSHTQDRERPDVRQLQAQDLPETPFPGGRRSSFRAFVEPAVHAEVWKHATENVAVEICGVLVGKWARDAEGPFVLVSGSIRGDAAKNKFAEVTFTHETWSKINAEMDSRFAQLAIVGWYHSHPDFGVFLSDRDLFIQEHFFSGAGQLAQVVDPVRRSEGIFAWQEGKPVLLPHYWIGDRIQVSTPAGKEAAPASTPAPANGAPAAGSAPAQAGGGWLPALTLSCLLLLVFLLGYLLAGKLSDLERWRIRRETMARVFRDYKIRDDLNQDVKLLAEDLEAVSQHAADLRKEHLELLKDRGPGDEKWTRVQKHLDNCRLRLAKVEATYCLTDKELELLLDRTQTRRREDRPAEPKPSGEAGRPPADADGIVVLGGLAPAEVTPGTAGRLVARAAASLPGQGMSAAALVHVKECYLGLADFTPTPLPLMPVAAACETQSFLGLFAGLSRRVVPHPANLPGKGP